MKRALVVIFGGLALTLLLLVIGTSVILRLSPDWRALALQVPRGQESLWGSATRFFEAMIAFVYVPTALLVGFLVGRFSSKHKVSSAIIATLPAWMPFSEITLHQAFISLVVAGAAGVGVVISKWVAHVRPVVGATLRS